MRTATVTINGVEYPAAFTLRVLANLEDRTGLPATAALDKLTSFDRIRDTAWLLAQLMKAGQTATGSDVTPPGEEQLLDGLALDDLQDITTSILASVSQMRPKVELQETKKAPATPRMDRSPRGWLLSRFGRASRTRRQ